MYVIVSGGVQSFQVTSADNSEVLLAITDVHLVSGRIYTLVAKGFSSPPGGNINVLSAQILFQ
ncbi:hypothetical protein BH23BAC2_BH23BAC2_27550 [soil metagenome]